MKQLFSSRLMRISMVMVLALGFCNDTNAQFGGLLNAAKRKVKKLLLIKQTMLSITKRAMPSITKRAMPSTLL